MASTTLRQVVGAQSVRVEHHLVLPDHATDRGNFGHVQDGLELVLQEPVLQGAQVGEVVPAAAVGQGVLVDPAHPGGIRPQRRFRTGRQARLHLVQVPHTCKSFTSSTVSLQKPEKKTDPSLTCE